MVVGGGGDGGYNVVIFHQMKRSKSLSFNRIGSKSQIGIKFGYKIVVCWALRACIRFVCNVPVWRYTYNVDILYLCIDTKHDFASVAQIYTSQLNARIVCIVWPKDAMNKSVCVCELARVFLNKYAVINFVSYGC